MIIMLHFIIHFKNRFHDFHPLFLQLGKSSTTESDDSKSVKLLTLLIYIAAQNNSLQFVDFIFSTSVGKVVFTHYKHNPTLPEDVARAYGHPILGNYLENVNKR